jgi:hypothetical protein
MFIPEECLGNLTRNPFSRWIYYDIDPDEISAVQSDDGDA